MPSAFAPARRVGIEPTKERVGIFPVPSTRRKILRPKAGTYACLLDPRWVMGGRLPNLCDGSFQHVTTHKAFQPWASAMPNERVMS